MKKLLFASAFALMGTFALANETHINPNEIKIILEDEFAEWYWYQICGHEMGSYSDTVEEADDWAFERWYFICGPGSGGPMV